MFRTLIAETVESEGGDRGLLILVALVAFGLVVAALRRRGGEEEGDAIDRIEVSGEDERGTADTSGSGIDRVSDEGTDYAEQSPPEGGDDEGEDGDEEDAGVSVEVSEGGARSRFDDLDAVDWVMVLATGVRAMREELQNRRAD
jgi:hypothetical protein